MVRRSLGFGIVRSVETTRARTRLADLCELLSNELGIAFVPHHPNSYSALVEACESGDVVLAWLPPLACIKLEDSGKASMLALPVRAGSVSYRAALITHATNPNSPKSVMDLRGTQVAWVDRESSSGYLVPRLYLEAAGVPLAGLFAEERFLGSHSDVVVAVASGRVDVGATYCALPGGPESGRYAAVTDDAPHSAPVLPRGPWSAAHPIRLLATTGAIPNDALVVSNDLPTDIRSSLLRWALNLRSGTRGQELCSELFGADSFRVSAPTHFDPLRHLVNEARVRLLEKP